MRYGVAVGLLLAMMANAVAGYAADGKGPVVVAPKAATAAPPKKPPPSSGGHGEFPWQISF